MLGEANCILGYGDLSRDTGSSAEAEGHYRAALAMYERVHRIDNIALTHERLASVTAGADRAAHAQAARDAWLSINLPEQAASVARRSP